jgi:tRNA dimethylallyltransferase
MYSRGLLEEAATLGSRFAEWSNTARQAIGYAEAFSVLAGDMTQQEAIERTALRTRRLAKRQMTWFRHQARVHWIDAGTGAGPDRLAEDVLRAWEQHGSAPLHV